MTAETSDPEPPVEDMQRFMVSANEMRRPPYTDREMWIAIRAALLGIVKAIDQFAPGKPLAIAIRAALLGIVSAIEMRWNLKRHKAN